MQKYLTLQEIAQGMYPRGLPLIFISMLCLYLHWECMQDSKQQNLTTTWSRRTYLCLYVGCSSTSRRSNFGCFTEDLLLLQCHAIFTCGITIFFIMKNGISMVNQQLILLCW